MGYGEAALGDFVAEINGLLREVLVQVADSREREARAGAVSME